MSKLDDILDHLHVDVSEEKQQIKDLMLELIGEDILIETEGRHAGRTMKPTRGKLLAVNRHKAELRKKVEEL